MSTYRVGNHQPQNVYRDDQYIGVMFTAEDAALVVEALNGGTVTEGWRRAVATLRDVAQRTGSPAAHRAAEYLEVDPDHRQELGNEPVCTDEWQRPHPAGSRPNMCATCGGLRSTDRTPVLESRFDERADVRRRIAERAEHRPSSLGDGLGYGPCVGCSELWPCAASRAERP